MTQMPNFVPHSHCVVNPYIRVPLQPQPSSSSPPISVSISSEGILLPRWHEEDTIADWNSIDLAWSSSVNALIQYLLYLIIHLSGASGLRQNFGPLSRASGFERSVGPSAERQALSRTSGLEQSVGP
ncbi:hypothetical protein M5K25_027454 [Dendrobium thyrsiflorum]|uniref:Uncharacterized protein n=1 Tax=Dendrobium thyrsiflorum TaxID=117978 RepID=A0ABD0U0E1_DENTH